MKQKRTNRGFSARFFFCFAFFATGLSIVPNANSQAYVGGGIGRSTATGPGGSLFGSDDSDTSYKIYGGYQFTPRWGAEAGYNDLGRLSADACFLFFCPSTTLSLKVHNWTAAGTVNWTFGQLMILLKLGVVRNETSGGVVCNPTCSPSGNESRTQVLGGFGLEYPVWKKLGARLEYERYGKATSDDAFRSGNSGAVTASSWSLSLKHAL